MAWLELLAESPLGFEIKMESVPVCVPAGAVSVIVPSVLVNEADPEKESVPIMAETGVCVEFPAAVFPVMAMLLISAGNAEKE